MMKQKLFFELYKLDDHDTINQNLGIRTRVMIVFHKYDPRLSFLKKHQD